MGNIGPVSLSQTVTTTFSSRLLTSFFLWLQTALSVHPFAIYKFSTIFPLFLLVPYVEETLAGCTRKLHWNC